RERTDAAGHAVGVAHDDAHALERNAQPLGDDLGERGLVALALRLSTDGYLDDAVGQHADLGELLGHPARALDVGADAEPAQPSTARGVAAPLRDAAHVPQRHRLVEPRPVVAGVVQRSGGAAIREGAHEVGPAQRRALAAGLAGGALDQPLHRVDAL